MLRFALHDKVRSLVTPTVGGVCLFNVKMLRFALHDKVRSLVTPIVGGVCPSNAKMLPDRRQAGALLRMTKFGALSLRS